MKNLSHYPFKSTISKCPSSQPCPTNLAVQRSNPSQSFSHSNFPHFQTTSPARFPNDGECPRHHGFVICRLARWKEPVNLCVRDFLQPAAGVGCLRGIGLILGIPRVLHVTGRPLVNGMQNTIRYWTSLHVIGGRKKLREWNRKLVCARTGVRALHSMNKPAGFTGLQKHRSLDRTPKKKNDSGHLSYFVRLEAGGLRGVCCNIFAHCIWMRNERSELLCSKCFLCRRFRVATLVGTFHFGKTGFSAAPEATQVRLPVFKRLPNPKRIPHFWQTLPTNPAQQGEG